MVSRQPVPRSRTETHPDNLQAMTQQDLSAEQSCKPKAVRRLFFSRWFYEIPARANTGEFAWHKVCDPENNFDEAKCTGAILALYECCHAFYSKQGDDARSLSCPRPDILRRRLETMKKGDKR
ncbi:uncharacterized protein BROUX77_007889 [Berkeleyomyces rouxiae]|uniref:uncharacterized protein n=1 Tax=Berkeleyomyces rouxiae TaxID=2035830 RepID=UPI003B7AD8E7